MPQYGAKGAGRKIASMNRHDILAARIISVPKEMVRPFGSNHFEAGLLQNRNYGARAAPAALSYACGGDRHQLRDRRGQIPVGGRN